MEIEAKFAVPDEATFAKLQAIDQLAGYALSAGITRQVHDTFVDTADRSILAAGHVLRRREFDNQVLMTMKGHQRVEGAVHRREELEVTLSKDMPVSEWPESEIRDRLLEMIGNVPLMPLFDQRQTRHVRLVTQGARTVGEWSLDRVQLSLQGREQIYLEVEVELKAEGTDDDLAVIGVCLTTEWGLRPEPRSKFSRALALFNETPAAI